MNTNKLLALVLALAAAGCRSGSYQRPPLPPQDVEVSNPDRVRVYVGRDDQARGWAHSIRVNDGDHEIGVMNADEYLCWERTPGRALLTFTYEGPKLDGGALEGVFSLEGEAGHAYYLGVHLQRKADDPELRTRASRPEIVVVDPARGREIVKSLKPVPVRD